MDFKNTVIIMTSNVGSQYLTEASENLEAAMPRVLEVLKSTFRPEFLQPHRRCDRFPAADPAILEGIVKLQLNALNRVLEQKGLKLETGEKAIAFLAHEGFDPVYGARPLKRLSPKEDPGPCGALVAQRRSSCRRHAPS